jgi:hypothetical protein
MNIGRFVVGVLLVAVVVGLFLMKLQIIRIVWSAMREVFRWGGESLDSTRERREQKRKD